MKWNPKNHRESRSRPEAERFGSEVVGILRRLYPAATIEVAGPLDLLVNGRHVGVDDLYRLVQSEPARRDEIVASHLRTLMESNLLHAATFPLLVARSRIMPRLLTEADALRPGMSGPCQLVTMPFVNNTVIGFVIHTAQAVVDVTAEDAELWGLGPEELDLLARDNLARFRPEVDAQFIDSADGGRLAIISAQDGYDSARLLLDSLYEELCQELRGTFYVAVPARDMFFAMTLQPQSFVDRLMRRFRIFNRTVPYPITSDLFIVTRDGIAGTVG